MICMADLLREITRGPGFITLAEPHDMDTEGCNYNRAEAPFAEVSRARSMHARRVPIKLIAHTLGRSANTVRDWVYMRTRTTS